MQIVLKRVGMGNVQTRHRILRMVAINGNKKSVEQQFGSDLR